MDSLARGAWGSGVERESSRDGRAGGPEMSRRLSSGVKKGRGECAGRSVHCRFSEKLARGVVVLSTETSTIRDGV